MYDLFSMPARRFTGAMSYPTLPYLRRAFREAIDDVQAYYRRYPKRVDSDNPLGNVLLHLSRHWEMDDRRYARYVQDATKGLIRVFGFTTNIHKGKIHQNGITLGQQTDEVVLSVDGDIDFKHAQKTWRNWSSYRYLYHTRTDLGLPVLNNHQPGRGYGVAVLDIPMMAIQYRYWLKAQHERGDQKESVYRFIGGVVLPNTLSSYLDIAFFNHLARTGRGIGTQRFPTPHPFYLTNYTSNVQQLCQQILSHQQHRSEDIEQIVNTTPMLVSESLWELIQLPPGPVSRHNEWALQLARLPYMRYLLETGVEQHKGDRHFLNEARQSLLEASQDRIFSGVGSADSIKHYRETIRSMIAHLNDLL